MATPFHVELVTPERILFNGEADEVTMRTDTGEISFLARHEDFIGASDITVVTIHVVSGGLDGAGEDAGEVLAAVHGGFVHVDHEGVRILAGIAELGAEIDVDRARRALEAAESRATSEPANKDHEDSAEPNPTELTGAMLTQLAPNSAQAALRRAQVRLEAAGAVTTA